MKSLTDVFTWILLTTKELKIEQILGSTNENLLGYKIQFNLTS